MDHVKKQIRQRYPLQFSGPMSIKNQEKQSVKEAS